MAEIRWEVSADPTGPWVYLIEGGSYSQSQYRISTADHPGPLTITAPEWDSLNKEAVKILERPQAKAGAGVYLRGILMLLGKPGPQVINSTLVWVLSMSESSNDRYESVRFRMPSDLMALTTKPTVE